VPTSTLVAHGDGESATSVERLPVPDLHYVFDDPAVGEPGRDRMMVHGLWELVLAIALAIAGYLLAQAEPGALGGDGLRRLALAAMVLGLVASASALALRAGVPNLAVGGVAVAGALYFAHHADGSWTPAVAAVGICAVIGLVQGLVVAGLHVPAWAASLAVALALLVWSGRQAPVVVVGGYEPTSHAYLWFAGFCVLSLGASLLGLMPTIRRGFGQFRPVIDPARRRGTTAALIVIGATVGSSVLAGLSSVFTVLISNEVAPTNGMELTRVLALGAALLGGTSAFGRRAGIFGTVFAVSLISVVLAFAEATDRAWLVSGLAVFAIAIGLGITRLVERFGRPMLPPPSTDDDDAWSPRVHSIAPSGEPGSSRRRRQPAGCGPRTTSGGRPPARLTPMDDLTDLDELSTEELRHRAFTLAAQRHDIGFFWSVLKHLPHADDVESLDASLGAVGASISDALALWRGVHRTWRLRRRGTVAAGGLSRLPPAGKQPPRCDRGALTTIVLRRCMWGISATCPRSLHAPEPIPAPASSRF
jgi:ribose/xylose/arabinose/galactoside ABC-type transport system permease subunit